METIMESLAIHTITFEAKYLGLPTSEGRLNVNKFQAISERMTKRCNAWEERYLSIGGKYILIKSVAQSLPVYTMSVF
jgi:hypothetical protein